MTLADYIAKHGTAAKSAIARAARIRWATVHDIAEGRSTPKVETAKKIAAATNGEVTVAELLGVDPSEAAA